jgi:putative two-component system hydrogenase maturation factor HypX/HoxX
MCGFNTMHVAAVNHSLGEVLVLGLTKLAALLTLLLCLCLATLSCRRARDEDVKPLESYRQEELAHMRDNMINNNWGFHEKRQAFVHKKKPTATCARIALHSVDGNN